MIKNKRKIENALIDKYYNEKYDCNLTNNDNDIYEKKIMNATKCMDALNEENINIDINIFEIIENAEKINEKRKGKIEGLMFVLTISLIISIACVLIFILGYKIIFISQLIIFSLIPFSLVPISIIALKGGIDNGKN